METKLEIGQRIDLYEVLHNTRYSDMTIGRFYPSQDENSKYYVGLPCDIDWNSYPTLHVHTQLDNISPECKKVGTMVIKSLK